MTDLEEFLQQYKKTGVGEYHFDIEELQGYTDKLDHQERFGFLAIKVGFDDEILSELSKVLTYPGEY